MEIRLTRIAHDDWNASVDLSEWHGYGASGATAQDAAENVVQYWRRLDGGNKLDMSGWFFFRRKV